MSDTRFTRAYVRRLYTNPLFSGSLQGKRGFFSNRGLPNQKDIEANLISLPEFSLLRPARLKYKTRKTVYPWLNHTFCSDLIVLTSYTKENQGYSYILLVMDGFSRYLWARKLKQKTGIAVANALSDIFKKSGRIPRYFHTDEGETHALFLF